MRNTLKKKKVVFLPMHHLKGFLIKSILDYAGDDIGCQITVCWVLFSGKDCSQGQENSCISSACRAAEMWERWERCLIPLGISGGEHFLNNTPAYNRKFCSARWGGVILLIQPSPRQMLWDTLDVYLAKPKSTSELGIILQGKKKGQSFLRSQP